MNIIWTGNHSTLTETQNQKIADEFRKVGKLLDKAKGEADARVILTQERHLNHAEIKVAYYDHDLIGTASDSDLFTAIHMAIGKLEAQAVKAREKWRDGKRPPTAEHA